MKSFEQASVHGEIRPLAKFLAAMNGQSTSAPKLPTIYAFGIVSCQFLLVAVQQQPPASGEVKELWKRVFA
ncbi:hypothetical protein PXJ20_03970 [Paraburkholderia sp. A1RI_3L]|uniref:hypothetical protein n=1 Tax=Paraburkholderia TaxID=1822464 RepID=UPI0018F44DD5|nr:hypothetical protein [Paraburkholderia kururiensis]